MFDKINAISNVRDAFMLQSFSYQMFSERDAAYVWDAGLQHV